MKCTKQVIRTAKTRIPSHCTSNYGITQVEYAFITPTNGMAYALFLFCEKVNKNHYERARNRKES